MANISLLSRLVNGVQRQVDLSANTLVVSDLLINGISLRNAATGTAGSNGIGDDNSYSNFTPSAATIKGALSGIDAALATAGGSTFSDSLFRVYDNGDATKQIALEASGIATATTRTITMPDADVNLGLVLTAIQRNGSVAFTANQPMGGFKLTGLGAGTTAGDSVRYEQVILASGVNAFAADQSFGGFKATNLADPTAGQDAVTLAYLTARIAGLKPKQAVRVATTANGALATAFAAGQVIDGVTLATGDRILIKDQTSAADNGIYIVAASGAPTRSTDFDSVSPIDEINGAWVAVQLGTVNSGHVYVQFGVVATVGTDPINFEFWNPIAGLIGGDMITFSGSTFSVDLATVSGLQSTNPGNVAGQLQIKLEASNPSLQIDGSNQLGAKLNPAGAIVSGASGLSAQVDGTSLEISSNAHRIKTTAYDQLTIVGGSGSAASVAYAPAQSTPEVAGESFAATTVRAVRFAKAADSGFVAGRVYKADYDTTTVDNFHAIGLVFPAGAVSAGQAIQVVESGLINVPTHGFTVGQPIFLTAAGAMSNTAPSTTLQASVILGYAKDANNIWVKIQIMGVN